MRAPRMISVVGCHAEGEVGDVIIGGVLPPPGATMLEKKLAFERDFDHIRRLLICEPPNSSTVWSSTTKPSLLSGPSISTNCGSLVML